MPGSGASGPAAADADADADDAHANAEMGNRVRTLSTADTKDRLVRSPQGAAAAGGGKRGAAESFFARRLTWDTEMEEGGGGHVDEPAPRAGGSARKTCATIGQRLSRDSSDGEDHA